jgi:O-antigen ligase/polysaccharide polymerase Wzy-like membrane protein
MGMMPFVMSSWHLYVAPYGFPTWQGYPKGIELSALDFIAVAICFAARGTGTKTRRLWPWILYIFAVIIAVPHAHVMIPATFYVWQLARMALIFIAATRLCAYPGASEALLKGLMAGICYQALFSINQAAHGSVQADGEFGAQNLLGLMTHFALFPAFALLLVGKRGWWPVVGFSAAVIVDVLTASRGTLGFAALGLALLGMLSCLNSFSGRKGAIISVGFLLALGITPLALNAIDARAGGNKVENSNEARSEMTRAAWYIIEDYPLGIGSNQYVLISNIGGYADRAGMNWGSGTRKTSVHNSYLLALAETGPIGLIAMILLLGVPILTSFRAAFRFKRDPRSEILLGLGVAMAIVSLHFMYEWIFVMFMVQYAFALSAGTAVGMATQLKAEMAKGLPARRALGSTKRSFNAPATA